MTASGVYLRTYLAPFSRWLEADGVTDILVNRPGEAWVDSGAGLQCVEAPDITPLVLQRLAQQVAASTSQGVSREHPLLSAILPDGARIQVIAPPATREHVALAIRRHVVTDRSLADYAQAGLLDGVAHHGRDSEDDVDDALAAQLDRGDAPGFLANAVRAGRTIVVSGGTGTGKTTFLNALLKEAPEGDRIVVIEDTPEVRLGHANSVGLVAVRNELGEARVSIDDLMQAALRMRPDRLLVGEIRGAEAFTFLRAVNTGHPGSMTTVHADDPEGALQQIAFMTLQAGSTLTRSDVVDYARSVIDVIVQLSRRGGARRVERIAFLRRP